MKSKFSTHKSIEKVGEGELNYCRDCQGGEVELVEQTCEERQREKKMLMRGTGMPKGKLIKVACSCGWEGRRSAFTYTRKGAFRDYSWKPCHECKRSGVYRK